jgi:hypothetical protein
MSVITNLKYFKIETGLLGEQQFHKTKHETVLIVTKIGHAPEMGA